MIDFLGDLSDPHREALHEIFTRRGIDLEKTFKTRPFVPVSSNGFVGMISPRLARVIALEIARSRLQVRFLVSEEEIFIDLKKK